jgi:Flp pilus assembly protein TadD
LGRQADAESTMKKAIALRSDNWNGYNSLGSFYLRATRYPEAAEAFRKVLELTPDNAAAYSNLGVALNRMQDRAGARKMYEKAIELNPTYAIYSNLAGLYYLDGAFQKAADTYEKALKLNDRDYRPWTGLASSYQALGRKEKFQAACNHALKLAEADAQRDFAMFSKGPPTVSAVALWMFSGLQKTMVSNHLSAAAEISKSLILCRLWSLGHGRLPK